MAAPVKEVIRNVHHEQLPLCDTRAAYRQGRKLTAVKVYSKIQVYTISDESKHLLIVGIPAIGLHDQVKQLCSRYGDVLSVVLVPKYGEEEFTDVFHVHYSKLQSSRFAKRQLDAKEFYGGILHVCYIPEMESVAETRQKLIQRRREVAVRCSMMLQTDKTREAPIRQYQRKTCGEATWPHKKRLLDPASVQCIWKGEQQNQDPRCSFTALSTNKVYGPQLPGRHWEAAGVLQRYFVPKQNKDSAVNEKKHHSDNLNEPSPLQGPSSITSSDKPAVLQFIPRQIKGMQRKIVPAKIIDIGEQPPDTSDKSLDTTVQAIRNRIRQVSVPNIKIHLSGKK